VQCQLIAQLCATESTLQMNSCFIFMSVKLKVSELHLKQHTIQTKTSTKIFSGQ